MILDYLIPGYKRKRLAREAEEKRKIELKRQYLEEQRRRIDSRSVVLDRLAVRTPSSARATPAPAVPTVRKREEEPKRRSSYDDDSSSSYIPSIPSFTSSYDSSSSSSYSSSDSYSSGGGGDFGGGGASGSWD